MDKPDAADAQALRTALARGYRDADARLQTYLVQSVERLDWVAAHHGVQTSAEGDWALIRGADLAFLEHLRDVLAQVASGEGGAQVLPLQRGPGQPRKDAGPAADEAEARIAAGEADDKRAVGDAAAKHGLSERAVREEIAHRKLARKIRSMSDAEIEELAQRNSGDCI